METKLRKTLVYTGLILCIITIGWIVLMALSLGEKGPLLTDYNDALDYIKNQGILFKLNYVNAILITFINTVFYALLYLYFRTEYPILSTIGIIFIPVYTVYALFAYTSQISIASQILNIEEYGVHKEIVNILLSQLTQAWNKSGIAFINNYAYSILGISSILFGIAFLRRNLMGKVTGWLSIANGVFCIIGIVGIILNNSILSLGSTIGGVAFIFFLIFSILYFHKDDTLIKMEG